MTIITHNMRLSLNSYNNCQQNKKRNTPNFQGNTSVPQVHTAKNPLKKLMPYIFGGMMITGGFSACSNESNQKYTENEINNGIRVEYYYVQKETRDSVMKPLFELKSKLNAENDFLEGVTVYVAKSTDNLNLGNSFTDDIKKNAGDNLKGRSFYSDALLPNRIFIQEDSHNGHEIYDKKNKRPSKIPAMRQTLMHETGHQFDNYFGHDHSAEFAQKYDSLLEAKELNMYENPNNFVVKTDEDFKILNDYLKNSALSDKKEFKKAVWKDVSNLRLTPLNSGNLPENIQYFVQSFDFSKPITPRDIEAAEHARGEIYANLFSYAVGQDDGEKEKFIKAFKNSYKIVKSDVKKYLKLVK